MLWHWRSGFELLPYVGSLRGIRSRWRKANRGLKIRPDINAPAVTRLIPARLTSPPKTVQGVTMNQRFPRWLELGGEERGWVYSNPVYVR